MIEANLSGRGDSWRSRYRQSLDNHKTVILRRAIRSDRDEKPPDLRQAATAVACARRTGHEQQPLPYHGHGAGMSMAMTEDEMRKRLEILRVEHRDLDAAIAALAENPSDQLRVARLKKRKLLLKDQILQLEDALIPDIIA